LHRSSETLDRTIDDAVLHDVVGHLRQLLERPSEHRVVGVVPAPDVFENGFSKVVDSTVLRQW